MAKENKEIRNENHILADLRRAQEIYASKAQDKSLSVAEVESAAAAIGILQRELDTYLTKGANVCPNCSNKPMGMLKTPAYMDRGVEFPNIWEIGCVYCPPFLVKKDDGTALIIEGETVKVKRRSYSARGLSQEQALEKWNAQEFVEDTLFERIPEFTPVYADI